MPDLLVKLYELPEITPVLAAQRTNGIEIRRALAAERHIVVAWVTALFSEHWGSECAAAFSRQPVSCYVAVEEGQISGFGCYDISAKGFFGPTGVSPEKRGRGTGKALLLACLQALYVEGYAYAIIGAAGPVDFYVKTVGAVVIEGSTPGIYRGVLRKS